jgi:hypothetical protein
MYFYLKIDLIAKVCHINADFAEIYEGAHEEKK